MKHNPSEPDEGPLMVDGQTYDEIYIVSWNAVIEQCKTKLEPGDYKRALEVTDRDTFRSELDKLQAQYTQDAPRHVILLLYPTLPHYEQFSEFFVKMMSEKVETSVMWGLLFLVVKLSLESEGAIERITRMLEDMSHQLRNANECAQYLKTYSQIKGDAVEINREMIILWVRIITVFRTQGSGPLNHTTWAQLSSMYTEAMGRINNAVTRIERVAHTAERQMRMAELEAFQKFVDPAKVDLGGAKLPCHMLPVAPNRRFFGRKQVLAQIEERLAPSSNQQGLRSLAIYGLGGVGKTQIALAYAHSKVEQLDAVFWVLAEDELTLQQGFSRIAVHGLKLPGTKLESHQENMLLVLNWLQQTNAKWLLVFDNVESHRVLSSCWPAASHGAVLVTTRRRVVASQPIDDGLEICDFSADEGARFIQHLLPSRKAVVDEETAALNLSEKLGGYPLAISQMAAYINARNLTIRAFLDLYDKYPQQLHKEKKTGWSYIGYNHSLETVWDISFEALSASANLILRVCCFYAPDSIQVAILSPSSAGLSAGSPLRFCLDEIARWDVIEQLTDHALVRFDIKAQSFSVHRLVQSEVLFRQSRSDRQAAFEAAVKLVLDKFPSSDTVVSGDQSRENGDRLLPHVKSLAKWWAESQLKVEALIPTTDFVNLMIHCARFVHDNDPGNMLSLVVDTAAEAYKKLPESEADQILWAGLLRIQAVRDLMISDFSLCEQRAREAYRLRSEKGLTDDLTMLRFYNILGLANDARRQYAEAKTWWSKIDAVVDKRAGEEYLITACTNNLNASRNLYFTGDFELSEKRLDVALEQATALNSWYFLSYTHQTYASLFSRSSNLNRAAESAERAADLLKKAGGGVELSWIGSLCSHRIATVAILRGEVEKAIEAAERALVLTNLCNCPNALRARAYHVLSMALLLDPQRCSEGKQAATEARRLRELVPSNGYDPGDESDEAYDSLVVSYYR